MKQLSGSAAVQGCPESCGGRERRQHPAAAPSRHVGITQATAVCEKRWRPGVSASLARHHALGSHAATLPPTRPRGPSACRQCAARDQGHVKQDRGLRTQAFCDCEPRPEGGSLRPRQGSACTRDLGTSLQHPLGLSLPPELRPAGSSPNPGGAGASRSAPPPAGPSRAGNPGQLVGGEHARDATRAWPSTEVP